MCSYFREKTKPIVEHTGVLVWTQNGDTGTYYQTVTIGGGQIQYFVPGSGACFHTYGSCDIDGFSGTIDTAPLWYHGGNPATFSQWFENLPTDVGIGSAAVYSIDMAKAYAKTNPTRPAVSLCNFFYELKDVPELLRKKGLAYLASHPGAAKGTLSQFSSTYLEFRYGWVPIVSDLLKMMGFKDDVTKTFKNLKKTFQDRGLSSKFTFFKDILLSSTPNENYGYARGTSSYIHDVYVYASMRWKSQGMPDSLTDDQLQTRAALLAEGLYVSPRAVWDALPWSWFIDWFSNVGDFISANQNVMDIYHTDEWVHTKIEAIRSVRVDHYTLPDWWGGQTGSLTGGNGTCRLHYYRRNLAPTAALMVASQPYLNSGQMSIAAALIGQRGLKV